MRIQWVCDKSIFYQRSYSNRSYCAYICIRTVGVNVLDSNTSHGDFKWERGRPHLCFSSETKNFASEQRKKATHQFTPSIPSPSPSSPHHLRFDWVSKLFIVFHNKEIMHHNIHHHQRNLNGMLLWVTIIIIERYYIPFCLWECVDSCSLLRYGARIGSNDNGSAGIIPSNTWTSLDYTYEKFQCPSPFQDIPTHTFPSRFSRINKWHINPSIPSRIWSGNSGCSERICKVLSVPIKQSTYTEPCIHLAICARVTSKQWLQCIIYFVVDKQTILVTR